MDSRVFPGRRCRLPLLPAMSLVSGTSEALETGTGLLSSVGSDDVTRIGDMLSGPHVVRSDTIPNHDLAICLCPEHVL